jgi:RNA polymerase sigma-70 factor (ECF subfamily)
LGYLRSGRPDSPVSAVFEDAGVGGMAPTAIEGEEKESLFRALDEMHRVAVRMMRRRRPGHTLQPSALVHEALIRLMTSGKIEREADQRRLLGTAVRAMRSVLVDHYRRRMAEKRGRDWVRHPLDEVLDHFEKREKLRFIDLHDALDELALLEPRQSLVVTFRYFLGMTCEEVREVLGTSLSSVEADWRLARAWLLLRLGDGGAR